MNNKKIRIIKNNQEKKTKVDRALHTVIYNYIFKDENNMNHQELNMFLSMTSYMSFVRVVSHILLYLFYCQFYFVTLYYVYLFYYQFYLGLFNYTYFIISFIYIYFTFDALGL